VYPRGRALGDKGNDVIYHVVGVLFGLLAASPAPAQAPHSISVDERGDVMLTTEKENLSEQQLAGRVRALRTVLADEIARRALCKEGHYLLSVGTGMGVTLRARCIETDNRADDAYWDGLTNRDDPAFVQTQLPEVAARNFPRSLQRLLDRDGEAVKRFEAHGQSLIVVAIANPAPYGRTKTTIEALLKAGASANLTTARGVPPIGLIANALPTIEPAETVRFNGGTATLIPNSENPEVAALLDVLLNAGADPNAGPPTLKPLHVMARRGWVSLVERLLKRGANVNEVDTSGRTALWVARYPAFAALVQLKANVNHVDNNGETVLFQILRDHKADSLDRLTRAIEAGADIRHRNPRGLTPLKLVTADKDTLAAAGDLSALALSEDQAKLRLAKRRIVEKAAAKR
jgi:ankyrin repeat protein